MKWRWTQTDGRRSCLFSFQTLLLFNSSLHVGASRRILSNYDLDVDVDAVYKSETGQYSEVQYDMNAALLIIKHDQLLSSLSWTVRGRDGLNLFTWRSDTWATWTTPLWFLLHRYLLSSSSSSSAVYHETDRWKKPVNLQSRLFILRNSSACWVSISFSDVLLIYWAVNRKHDFMSLKLYFNRNMKNVFLNLNFLM